MIDLKESPPRPDAEVLHDVLDRLERDARYRDARVGISVDADVVTLTGEVGSVALKHHLEHAVHRVPGVLAVASELIAVRPEKHARDDHDLARAAAAVLRSEGCCDLEVTVSQAVVTLDGRVDWPYQRARAERAVAEVPGVARVDNRIRLVERVSAWQVKRGIEGELQRQAARTARGIKVDLEDNRVTLSGRVRSARERDDVERAAWNVPGVLEVRNRLEIFA